MKIEKFNNNYLYIHLKNNNIDINIFLIILIIIIGGYCIYEGAFLTGDFWKGLFFLILLLVSLVNKMFFTQIHALISLDKETGIVLYRAYNLFRLKIKDLKIFYSSIKKINKILDYSSDDNKSDTYKLELTLLNDKKFVFNISLNKEEAEELTNLIKNYFKEQ